MPELEPFRLVGGTALSLLKGHRLSVDIDMFSNQPYGTIDFGAILQKIRQVFPIVENPIEAFPKIAALQINDGLKLNIGYSEVELVKTDILYWDLNFLDAPVLEGGIRLASVQEIAAMKLDVISRGGRKKDFWDLVEILEEYQLSELLDIYEQVFPYHDIQLVKDNLCNFSVAEEVPDPICLRSRSWAGVKHKISEIAGQLGLCS